MSVADLITEELNDQKFDSVEEYNAEILRIVRSIEEDLGRSQRWFLSEEGRKDYVEEEECE